MDVSEWTVDQRMRLPDWCFGNRDIYSVYHSNGSSGTRKWNIGDIALPDPACIWQVMFVSSLTSGANGNFRFGLADNVPTSQAEMDASVDIFPAYGTAVPRPPTISCWVQPFVNWLFDSRRGLETGGKKLVIEVYCVTGEVRAQVMLVVSGLPTHMAGWLAHNKV